MTSSSLERCIRAFCAFLLAGFAFLAPPVAQAQVWEPTGGPGQVGRIVPGMVAPPTATGSYWIGVLGAGVFKSSDGNNWTAANYGLVNKRVSWLQVGGGTPPSGSSPGTPPRAYVATRGGGVYKSTDGGANWMPINNGLGCAYVRSLHAYYDPTAGAPDVLLAGTDCNIQSGIYRSADSGMSWTLTTGLPEDVTVYNVSRIGPRTDTNKLAIAATDQGIFKSTDDGITWAASNGAITGPNGGAPVAYSVAGDYVQTDPQNTATGSVQVLVVTTDTGVYRSEDLGATWSQPASLANKLTVFGVSSDKEGNFWVNVDGEGIYTSVDKGVSWTLVNWMRPNGKPMPFASRVMHFSDIPNSPNYLVATAAGMYRSADNGATWTNLGTVGLPHGYAVNIEADRPEATGDAYAAFLNGVAKCAGAVATTPSDCTWQHIGGRNLGTFTLGGEIAVAKPASQPAQVFAVTSNLGVFKYDSTNDQWIPINNGLPTNLAHQGGVLSHGPQGIFVGFDGLGIYALDEASGTWVAKNEGLTGAAKRIRHIAQVQQQILMATAGGLFASADGGASWSKLPFPAVSPADIPLPADNVAIDPGNGNFYAAVFRTDALGFAYPQSGVWKSTDGGATWTQLEPLAGKKAHRIKVARNPSGATLYAALWDEVDGGVMQSTDEGVTWTPMNSGLTNTYISSLGVAGGVLKAVSTYGDGVLAWGSGTGGTQTMNEWVWAGVTLEQDSGNTWYGVNMGIPLLQSGGLSVTGFTLSGPGAATPLQATNNGNQWQVFLNFGNLGSTAPQVPATYTANIAFSDGTTKTKTFTVEKWSNAFPTSISLAPNSIITGTTLPDINWTNAPGTGITYRGYLFTAPPDGQAVQVWPGVFNLPSGPIVYSGPPLMPGVNYKFYLASSEFINGVQYAAQVGIPFCYQQCSTGGPGPAPISEWKSVHVNKEGANVFYGVSFGTNDPQGVFASVTLSTNGATANGVFMPSSQTWHADLNFGQVQPSLANIYTVTLVKKDQTSSTKTFQIDKIPTAFPTNLQPSGGQNVIDVPTLTWTPAPMTNFNYNINMADAASGSPIWSMFNITTNSVFYSGPPLTPGTMYRYWVVANEFNPALEIGYNMGAADTFCYQCSGGATTTSTTIPGSTTTTTTGGATTTTTSSTTTTTQVTLNFGAGWNLVGNSADASLDVATAFGDTAKVTTVWKWIADTARWAFYAPSLGAQQLIDYAASKGYDVLATIAGGEGFWVNAKGSFTAQLPAGNAISAASFQDPLVGTGKLVKGWNLIAIGDNKSPSEFNKALSSTPPAPGEIPLNLTTLWAWDSAQSNWYFYAPSLEKNGTLSSYIASKNYLDFDVRKLDPAAGFWVNKP